MKPRIKFNPDKDLVLAIVVGVVGCLVALIMFFLSGYMITQSALGAPLFSLMIIIVTVKLFGFMRAIARYIERLLSHRTTFTMLRDVRVQFFEKLLPVIPDVYRRHNSSDLINKMISRVEALQNIYLRVYYPPIVIGLTVMISIVVMLFFSWVHALIIAVSMLISLLVIPWLSARRAQHLKKYSSEQQQHFLTTFYDYHEGYEELERFNQTEAYYQHLSEALNRFEEAQSKEQRFLIVYEYSLNIVSMVALILTLSLGILQVHDGQLDVVYLTSIVLMMLTIFEQAVPMSNVAYYKADTDAALQDINEVIQHPVKQGTETIGNISEPYSAHVLEITDIHFKYWNQKQYVLEDINLSIRKGEHVAIIGASGSGKSTLLQMMSGLYQTEKGEVRLYNRDINKISDESKYQNINALLQSQQLFDGNIKDNLFTQADDAKIRKVLNQLGLDHIPLNKDVTISGETLSGGEAQRIGIARLLLRNAPIWVLDEPTTSLDINHSDDVMALIQEHAQTLIVATHDLRILPKFDRIIVISEGQIVESGSYKTLIQSQGYLSEVMKMNQ
ncbi:thiol reductant ABC exporter subunit CydC [Staphylococcus sp. Marseille-Q6910]|uniref:thiol reductant ABC exporter subunit CydC n=1 Tax=Staphylococcus sp. Marseille-Q6910 TaxID=2937990 RepID=UPI00203FEEBE|nr:thiol reductant ABC exporter subunit CydC [Staphylococcus sp. Marseille-Q6910]